MFTFTHRNPEMNLDKKHTALVLADMQNEFLEEKPQATYYALIADALKKRNVVANLKQLLKTAQDLGYYLQARLPDFRRRGDSEAMAAMEQGFRSGGWRGALKSGIQFGQTQRKTGYSSAYEIGALHAELGEKDQAFQWLNIAYQERDSLLLDLKTDSMVTNWCIKWVYPYEKAASRLLYG